MPFELKFRLIRGGLSAQWRPIAFFRREFWADTRLFLWESVPVIDQK